ERISAARAVAHYPLVVVASAKVSAILADWRRTAVYLIAIAVLSAALIAGFVLLFCRQFRNYQSLERARAEQAEAEKLREQKLKLDAALNNMSQGLCMFDSQARLVLCNDRYLDIYGLSPEVAKPGCSLRDLMEHRKSAGFLARDPEQYCR